MDTIIEDKILAVTRQGRTLIHVIDEQHPGDGFAPVKPELEDVYFATIAGRHTVAPNC